jgi:DNA-binding transcriptional LysR family regulator
MAKIDLNLMAVLEAIYDEGNTSRAAEALHLSQSAVSHALNRLRSLYDDPLFTRQGHMMMPSPLTERVIVQVKQGLQELRRSVDDAHRFDPASHQQTFQLSQRDAMEAMLLPILMERIEQQAPQIRLNSTHSAPPNLVDQLVQGQVDLSLELELPVPEYLHHICLFKDPLIVVGRLDHPFFDNAESLDAFLQYPQVLVSPLLNASEWIDMALAKKGLQRNVTLRCSNYPSGIHSLLKSDKLSIMPRGYIEAQKALLPLQTAPLPFASPAIEIHMYWHQRHHHDPAHRWLRTQLIHSLQALDTISLEPDLENLALQ